MSFVHGKNTVVMIGAADISAFTNATTFSPSADSHDTTTYGKNSHTFAAGLKNGTANIAGTYDSAETGTPAIILMPLIGGATTEFVYRPAGTGVGKPERTGDVLVTAYEESAPVADMITWTATLQFSDDIVDDTQSA